MAESQLTELDYTMLLIRAKEQKMLELFEEPSSYEDESKDSDWYIN